MVNNARGSFDIFYQLMQTPWDTQAMYIEIEYWSAGVQLTSTVFIEDFEVGDFGIQLAPQSTFEWDEGTLYYNGEDHAEYISNHGAYITVPEEAPVSPPMGSMLAGGSPPGGDSAWYQPDPLGGLV